MADVAARAGVSRATVSRVLSGSDLVQDRTREEVLAVVRSLGYVPNAAAQGLAGRNPLLVGLLLRDPRNPVYGSIHYELQEAMEEAGLHLVTVSPGRVNSNEESAGLTRLMSTRPSGLIVATGSLDLDELQPFARQVPIVVLPRPVDSPCLSSVSFDEEMNSRLIADAIIDHGHRRVCVSRPLASISSVEHLRATKIVERIQERGGQTQTIERTIANLDIVSPQVDAAVAAGCTAVAFPNDVQAANYIAYLHATGRKPGKDVSVTGIDGVDPWRGAMGLASVVVPVREVAHLAVEIMRRGLFAASEEEDEGSVPGVKTEPTKLTIPGMLSLGPTLARVTPDA